MKTCKHCVKLIQDDDDYIQIINDAKEREIEYGHFTTQREYIHLNCLVFDGRKVERF
jgi:hypothetical protein